MEDEYATSTATRIETRATATYVIYCHLFTVPHCLQYLCVQAWLSEQTNNNSVQFSCWTGNLISLLSQLLRKSPCAVAVLSGYAVTTGRGKICVCHCTEVHKDGNDIYNGFFE